MIRNIVLGRLRDGADPDAVEAGFQEFRDLRVPGVELNLVVERDLGLRDGNEDFAIIADLADEAAYRAYDEDPQHNRIRSSTLGPLCSSIERVQVEIPDAS